VNGQISIWTMPTHKSIGTISAAQRSEGNQPLDRAEAVPAGESCTICTKFATSRAREPERLTRGVLHRRRACRWFCTSECRASHPRDLQLPVPALPTARSLSALTGTSVPARSQRVTVRASCACSTHICAVTYISNRRTCCDTPCGHTAAAFLVTCRLPSVPMTAEKFIW
jgi:hypothetical protein